MNTQWKISYSIQNLIGFCLDFDFKNRYMMRLVQNRSYVRVQFKKKKNSKH